MLRLLSLALLLATTAHAQVTRVVDNNLNAPSGDLVYTEAQAALDAAVDGDTIQFVPSPTSYGAVSVYRRLAIRGSSFRERPEQGGHVVTLGSISLTTSQDPQDPQNPSGTSFEGIVFGTLRGFGTGIQDVLVENCFVNAINPSTTGFRLSSLTVRRSVVNSVSGGLTTPNLRLTNNVFLGGVGLGSAVTNQVVDHNLFANSGISGDNVLASNNIFLTPVAAGTVRESVFTNNISFSNTGFELPPPGSTNSGTGNLQNVNPRLVDFPTATTMSTVLDTDFRLEPNSPALGAASDGTDIGPLGGATPFTSFFSGSAPSPFVTVLDVSPAVFVGAPLTVGIEASGELPDVDGDAPAPAADVLPAQTRGASARRLSTDR